MANLDIILIIRKDSQTYETALQSVLNQSFMNWHLIILLDRDNGTIERILKKRLKNYSFIIIAVNFEKTGIAPIRNIGLSYCTSKYISFLDDDDFYHAEKSQRQIDLMEGNSNIVLVTCYTKIIGPSNKAHNSLSPISSDELLKKQLAVGNLIAQSSILFRSSILASGFKYDDSLVGCEDYDFFLRLGINNKFSSVQETLLFYKSNPLGISKRPIPLKSTFKLFRSYVLFTAKTQWSFIEIFKLWFIFFIYFIFHQNIKVKIKKAWAGRGSNPEPTD